MREDMTIENCTAYLEENFFTDIRPYAESKDALYFVAIDEDGEEKEIEFDTLENDVDVCVSVKEDGIWYVLEILRDSE
jgi:hypothetical protein